MNTLTAYFRAEWHQRARGNGPAAATGFFFLTGAMTPLALGIEAETLRAITPGLLWVLASLASLLAIETMVADDVQDGNLEILTLAKPPFWLLLIIKFVTFWFLVIVPLVVAAFPLSLLLGNEPARALIICLALLVGTPALVFLGGAIASICAGLKRGTGLVIFLAMPLYAPALIFGSRAAGEDNVIASFLFLGAFSLQALAICPPLASAALKQHME